MTMTSYTEYKQHIKKALSQIMSEDDYRRIQSEFQDSRWDIISYLNENLSSFKTNILRKCFETLQIPQDLSLETVLQQLSKKTSQQTEQQEKRYSKVLSRFVIILIIKEKLNNIQDFNALYKYFCILKVLLSIMSHLENDGNFTSVLSIFLTDSYEKLRETVTLRHKTNEHLESLLDKLQQLQIERQLLPTQLSYKIDDSLEELLQRHKHCTKIVVACHSGYNGQSFQIPKRVDNQSVHIVLPNSIGHYFLSTDDAGMSRSIIDTLADLLKTNDCFTEQGVYTDAFKQWVKSLLSQYYQQQSTSKKGDIWFTDHTGTSLKVNDLEIEIGSNYVKKAFMGLVFISPDSVFTYDIEDIMKGGKICVKLSNLVDYCSINTQIRTFIIYGCRNIYSEESFDTKQTLMRRGRTVSFQGRIQMAKQKGMTQTTHQTMYKIENDELKDNIKRLRTEYTSMLEENDKLKGQNKLFKDRYNSISKDYISIKTELDKLKEQRTDTKSRFFRGRGRGMGI
jgi:hypothetical protein